MKNSKYLCLMIFLLVGFYQNFADETDVKYGINYQESQVPEYTLPDPLLGQDGQRIVTADDWFEKRRPEILHLFQEEMYGSIPPADAVEIRYEHLSTDENALDSKAVQKEIRIHFGTGENNPYFDLLIYYPKNVTKPVPAFLGLNFKGNHTCTNDPDVLIAEQVSGSRYGNISAERGTLVERWNVTKTIEAGYAIVTGYYEQIAPDQNIRLGVLKLFEESGQIDFDNLSHISVWAWGLSRALDCVTAEISEINAEKVIVLGHSRLGKTALWAGANDQRFAGVISNDSGCGGAALARRRFGEKYNFMIDAVPYWFRPSFKKYVDRENELPFDQHELIALIAPRPVYVASAELDTWADPKGEFLSALGADPVYRLLGTDGIGAVTVWPSVDRPIGKTIRYHVRRW